MRLTAAARLLGDKDTCRLGGEDVPCAPSDAEGVPSGEVATPDGGTRTTRTAGVAAPARRAHPRSPSGAWSVRRRLGPDLTGRTVVGGCRFHPGWPGWRQTNRR